MFPEVWVATPSLIPLVVPSESDVPLLLGEGIVDYINQDEFHRFDDPEEWRLEFLDCDPY